MAVQLGDPIRRNPIALHRLRIDRSVIPRILLSFEANIPVVSDALATQSTDDLLLMVRVEFCKPFVHGVDHFVLDVRVVVEESRVEDGFDGLSEDGVDGDVGVLPCLDHNVHRMFLGQKRSEHSLRLDVEVVKFYRDYLSDAACRLVEDLAEMVFARYVDICQRKSSFGREQEDLPEVGVTGISALRILEYAQLLFRVSGEQQIGDFGELVIDEFDEGLEERLRQ